MRRVRFGCSWSASWRVGLLQVSPVRQIESTRVVDNVCSGRKTREHECAGDSRAWRDVTSHLMIRVEPHVVPIERRFALAVARGLSPEVRVRIVCDDGVGFRSSNNSRDCTTK
jgi:hypothetical protein